MKPTTPNVTAATAYQLMTEPTRTVADYIVDREKMRERGVTLVNRQIGVKVAEVMTDPDTYGQTAVQLLAQYVGLSTAYLYFLKDYSEAFTETFLRKCQEKRMKNGRPITQAHLFAVQKIHGEEDRIAFLEMACSKSLSAKQLVTEVEAKCGKVKKRSRTLKNPGSPIEALMRVLGTFKTATKHIVPLTNYLSEHSTTDCKAVPLLAAKLQEAHDLSLELTAGLQALDEIVCAQLKGVQRAIQTAGLDPVAELKSLRPGVVVPGVSADQSKVTSDAASEVTVAEPQSVLGDERAVSPDPDKETIPAPKPTRPVSRAA